MRACHDDADVLTLRRTVSPALTLKSAAKPSMLELGPFGPRYQSLCGAPASAFSVVTALVAAPASDARKLRSDVAMPAPTAVPARNLRRERPRRPLSVEPEPVLIPSWV